MQITELERVLNGLSEKNYVAAVQYITYLSDCQRSEQGGNPAPRILGLAKGEFEIPDNIDGCNDQVAELWR